MSHEVPDQLPVILLRIPGSWASPRDLNEKLAAANTGYQLSLDDVDNTATLGHVETGKRFTFEVAGPDNEIADVFAGNGRITEAEIEAIRDHDVKVFVSGPGGSVEAAAAMMQAGAAIIRAGGLGVLVDNSGATHGPADWLALSDDAENGGVYWGLVVVTGSRHAVFSTGMQCLGFRDAEILDPPSDLGHCGYLLHNFLGYSYRSGAILVDGDPIGESEGAMFHIRHVNCEQFAHGSTFFNPYGLWRLDPIVDAS